VRGRGDLLSDSVKGGGPDTECQLGRRGHIASRHDKSHSHIGSPLEGPGVALILCDRSSLSPRSSSAKRIAD
jgi:hypothetical protein